MGFKIELPPQPKENNFEIEAENRIKKMVTDDFENKGGLYAKCLVFISMERAVSITELTNLLMSYYKIDVDRSNIWRIISKLDKLGVLNNKTTGEVLITPYEERNEIDNLIEAKHRKFLSKLQKHLQGGYNNVNYFYISNGSGLKILEWALNLLGYKYKDEKK